MEMTIFRMPAPGEGWRHYRGGLYEIVGVATDHDGHATVVYKRANAIPSPGPLFVQPLGRFLQAVEEDIGKMKEPRFVFEREAEPANPEVTPEMVQAGVECFGRTVLRSDSVREDLSRLAVDIFKAMLSERRGKWPSGPA